MTKAEMGVSALTRAAFIEECMGRQYINYILKSLICHQQISHFSSVIKAYSSYQLLNLKISC
uniref:Alternative protein GFRA1 n=1 Tax=Homo sapiens TaxID=9606 RepID=L8ECC2_HUMAN|nr:alternative protein GFRA1 [Homo sapiens]